MKEKSILKLKYLYIEKYKKLNNFELQLLDIKENDLFRRIYNDLNITVFVGENGTGKTTILSFISIIFRNLQRFQKLIPCNFKIIYELENNKGKEIIIEKKDANILLTYNNETNLLL